MSRGYCYNLGLRFEAVAEERRQTTALRFPNGTELSYQQCRDLSSQFAHLLICKGIQTGDVVALATDKHPMAFVVMLACLKIGAPYLNVDFASPLERLKKIFDRAKPTLLVYENKTLDFANNLADAFDISTIDCSTAQFTEKISRFETTIPDAVRKVPGSTPAYVMFTSGSTGFPKGAIISHSAVLNFLEWAEQTIPIDTQDILTNINPMHFDNSVFDFYASLFLGATLVPIGGDLVQQPMKMVRAVEAANCTIWFSVPSMLIYAMRMRAISATSFPSLKKIVFGGEGFPKSSLRKLFDLVGNRVQFVNVYGPTECTCICSSYPVTIDDMASDELLPLGPIAPNFDFVVIDENGKKAPDGEIGELYLRGPNVGLGYLNDPKRTEQAFVPTPTVAGYVDRCYRTGDLVRYRPQEDLLYFAGRADNQVKRMGYRIELEEIEYSIGSISGVRENACIFIREPTDDVGRIVAFVAGDGLDPKSLREKLGDKIPSYMIPNDFNVMDVLPKNRNGKIDRLALKEKFDT